MIGADMKKYSFFSYVLIAVTNALSGLDGNEAAGIKKHKLRFRLGKWRLYKVWSSLTDKQYYIISENVKLPKEKYKAFRITGGMKRLNDNLFYWRDK